MLRTATVGPSPSSKSSTPETFNRTVEVAATATLFSKGASKARCGYDCNRHTERPRWPDPRRRWTHTQTYALLCDWRE